MRSEVGGQWSVLVFEGWVGSLFRSLSLEGVEIKVKHD